LFINGKKRNRRTFVAIRLRFLPLMNNGDILSRSLRNTKEGNFSWPALVVFNGLPGVLQSGVFALFFCVL